MPKKLSDEQVARIHALRAVGFGQQDIADMEGINRNTVKNYLLESRQRVENGEEPLEVFGKYVETLLEVQVRPKVDA